MAKPKNPLKVITNQKVGSLRSGLTVITNTSEFKLKNIITNAGDNTQMPVKGLPLLLKP